MNGSRPWPLSCGPTSATPDRSSAAADVARVRATTGDRKRPWTQAELEASLPVALTPLGSWNVTASHNTQAASGGLNFQGWSTTVPQQAGMWYQIELPEPALLTEIHFNSTMQAAGRGAVPGGARRAGAPAAGPATMVGNLPGRLSRAGLDGRHDLECARGRRPGNRADHGDHLPAGAREAGADHPDRDRRERSDVVHSAPAAVSGAGTAGGHRRALSAGPGFWRARRSCPSKRSLSDPNVARRSSCVLSISGPGPLPTISQSDPHPARDPSSAGIRLLRFGSLVVARCVAWHGASGAPGGSMRGHGRPGPFGSLWRLAGHTRLHRCPNVSAPVPTSQSDHRARPSSSRFASSRGATRSAQALHAAGVDRHGRSGGRSLAFRIHERLIPGSFPRHAQPGHRSLLVPLNVWDLRARGRMHPVTLIGGAPSS